MLIKVEAAPVNPSDLLFIQGTYPAGKKAPCVPGLEGSGIVVEVTYLFINKQIVNKYLNGLLLVVE